MCHHPLLVMSLSGSAVVIMYALLYPAIKRYISISWQRAILKAAIFFYLFPLPLFKEAIVSFMYNSFPTLVEKDADIQTAEVLNLSYAVNLEPGNFFFGPEVVLISIFVCCMGIITSFIVIRRLKQYFALSRVYQLTVFSEEPSSVLVEQFEQIKEDLGIKRKVNFVRSQLCKTPITIGLFSPKIVLPTDDSFRLEPICYTYILKHELLHIKSRDSLVRILSLVVLALHWYNPICYFLYREICVVCEMNCDHEMIQGSDEEFRQTYSNLILELSTNNPSQKEKYAIGLVNGDVAAFERRLLEMKTSRKRSPLLLCVIILTLCLVGSVTAFAYEAPQQYKIEDFDSNNEYLFSSFSAIDQTVPLPSNIFFTDKEGNVFPLDMVTSKAGCNHHLVEGTLSEHAKKNNGGCVVTVREAWRCSYCGYVETGDIISKTEYTICPH